MCVENHDIQIMPTKIEQIDDDIVDEKRAPANAAEQEALDIYGPKDYKAEPILDVGPYAKTMISNQTPENQEKTREF